MKSLVENGQNEPHKIVIGTRGSELALTQANIVAKAIARVAPFTAIEIRTITTHGDTNQKPIPREVNGKGWFTKEIEDELLAGKIDIAVHSLKDVAERQPEGLALVAYLSREDARDALITKNGEPLEQLRVGAIVGTDSPRRQIQMLAMRPDLKMTSLRGNVPTRLKKLDGAFEEKYDAIILAVAGLKRLGLEKRITRIFEPDDMIPAPGQGILVIEARTIERSLSNSTDDSILKILAKINNDEAMQCAKIERSFARATGAGCKSPTGAYVFRDGDMCRLVGMIARGIGSKIERGEMSAPWNRSEKIGEQLAQELLARLGSLDTNIS